MTYIEYFITSSYDVNIDMLAVETFRKNVHTKISSVDCDKAQIINGWGDNF